MNRMDMNEGPNFGVNRQNTGPHAYPYVANNTHATQDEAWQVANAYKMGVVQQQQFQAMPGQPMPAYLNPMHLYTQMKQNEAAQHVPQQQQAFVPQGYAQDAQRSQQNVHGMRAQQGQPGTATRAGMNEQTMFMGKNSVKEYEVPDRTKLFYGMPTDVNLGQMQQQFFYGRSEQGLTMAAQYYQQNKEAAANNANIAPREHEMQRQHIQNTDANVNDFARRGFSPPIQTVYQQPTNALSMQLSSQSVRMSQPEGLAQMTTSSTAQGTPDQPRVMNRMTTQQPGISQGSAASIVIGTPVEDGAVLEHRTQQSKDASRAHQEQVSSMEYRFTPEQTQEDKIINEIFSELEATYEKLYNATKARSLWEVEYDKLDSEYKKAVYYDSDSSMNVETISNIIFDATNNILQLSGEICRLEAKRDELVKNACNRYLSLKESLEGLKAHSSMVEESQHEHHQLLRSENRECEVTCIFALTSTLIDMWEKRVARITEHACIKLDMPWEKNRFSEKLVYSIQQQLPKFLTVSIQNVTSVTQAESSQGLDCCERGCAKSAQEMKELKAAILDMTVQILPVISQSKHAMKLKLFEQQSAEKVSADLAQVVRTMKHMRETVFACARKMEKTLTHESQHARDHESKHAREHESQHVRDHESQHVHEHESKHARDHESQHAREHESKHARDHESEHVHEHESQHVRKREKGTSAGKEVNDTSSQDEDCCRENVLDLHATGTLTIDKSAKRSIKQQSRNNRANVRGGRASRHGKSPLSHAYHDSIT